MRDMEPNSIDAIVTDPPYELGFMGKSWDNAGVSYDPDTWRAALRVLKPGGHTCSPSAAHGRITGIMVAIEDAGFEIRDCLMWLYGSGFPKALDLSKGIDREAGAEREIAAKRATCRADDSGADQDRTGCDQRQWHDNLIGIPPATDAAQTVAGLGHGAQARMANPSCMAQQPADWHRGRERAQSTAPGRSTWTVAGLMASFSPGQDQRDSGSAETMATQSELAANITILAAGPRILCWTKTRRLRWTSRAGRKKRAPGYNLELSQYDSDNPTHESRISRAVWHYGDSGGASRFFYVAKASRKERNLGLPDGMTNSHPTVKPLSLMRWLCRLVTPPGGVILDPFAGSGTTGCAAALEGFRFIGIEQDADYCEIADDVSSIGQRNGQPEQAALVMD